jgi:hypothetical protein
MAHLEAPPGRRMPQVLSDLLLEANRTTIWLDAQFLTQILHWRSLFSDNVHWRQI